MADDSYLSIAAIANNEFMTERMNAAATQQQHLGDAVFSEQLGEPPFSALSWVVNFRYVWASSPGWGAAWDYALNSHTGETDYEPGKDPGVITDGMILSAIQELAPPPPSPAPEEAP